MSLIKQWSVFRERRLTVPVPPEALVLDVGSGDKPSWRADVLLDRYAGDDYAGQRSGMREARVSRPLFDADAADMPFRDGAFDYAICSHLLEHVTDPEGVARELTRVAKAGYIEVPSAASAKIVDFPSHLWWCRLDEGDDRTLVLTAKSAPYFDAEIDAYIQKAGVRSALDGVLNRSFEHRVIQLWWEGGVKLRTEGVLDPEFAERAVSAEGYQRTWETRIVKLLTDTLTWRQQRRVKGRRIPYDSVVKPELRRGDGALLERRIYSVDG